MSINGDWTPELPAGISAEILYDGLMRLVEKRGIRCLADHQIPEVPGEQPLGLCVCLDGELCIGIRGDLPISRKTYVLAHELGHFMLHRNESVWPRIMFDLEYHSRIEREAETFTRKLLALIRLRLTAKNGADRGESSPSPAPPGQDTANPR